MTADVRIESRQTLEPALESRLQEFNEQQAGPLHASPVALSIRAEDGRLMGGLVGETFWNVLYVHTLRVEESSRRQGFGARLLAAAEVAGRERGCDLVYLSTFAFQAPTFFTRCGYTRFGELEGVPKGSSRLWRKKSLRP